MKKIFRKLTDWTLMSKLIRTAASIIEYLKDWSLVAESLHSDELRKLLKKYLRADFRKDWIGREYAVINPNIDMNGNLDFNNMIIEIDDERTNSDDYVKAFIYKQMDMIGELFKIKSMYDYVSCDIKKLDDYDNFLVVFDIASRKAMASMIKKTVFQILMYAALCGCAFLFLI